ncbi:Cytochrome b5 like protein [Verticillium longisporum]|nr:Cytochrome b5 like protein [Verticillium longisporum]
MADVQEFTAKEVAAHNTRDDCWMIIQGQVYDVTKYIHDHPGGADVLIDAAGQDATVEFDNAGHSEDAFEIMAEYHLGKYKGMPTRNAPKPVILKAKAALPTASSPRSLASKTAGALAILSLGADIAYQASCRLHVPSALLPKLRLRRPTELGFIEGFAVATAVFAVASAVVSKKLAALLHFEEAGFMPPSSSTRRFYSGIGGAGNVHAAGERPAVSFEEEIARARAREKSGVGRVGIGGAGNIFRRKKKEEQQQGHGDHEPRIEGERKGSLWSLGSWESVIKEQKA